MNTTRSVVSIATLLGCLALSAPAARTQFGPATPPRLRFLAMGAAAPRASGRTLSLNLYPVAPFLKKGCFTGDTLWGGLIAAEAAFVPDPNKPNSYAFGGWFWGDGASDIYEFHGKYYFAREWGVQVGILGSTSTSGNPYDIFLIRNFSSADRQPNAKRQWNVQLGAGLYVDPSGGNYTKDFTGYVQGSLSVSDRWTADISYWYVHADGIDFGRFALGVGTKF